MSMYFYDTLATKLASYLKIVTMIFIAVAALGVTAKSQAVTAQIANCSDPFEITSEDQINNVGLELARTYRRCFSQALEPDYFHFTATAGKQYRLEAFNLGPAFTSGRFSFSLYKINADNTVIPVALTQGDPTRPVATTPPLEAARYGIKIFSFDTASGGGAGFGYDFRLLVNVTSNLPEALQASVRLSVNPNPAVRGGQRNYTAVVANVGTKPITGSYFEADLASPQETLIVNSVFTTRGRIQIQNVFGGTRNRIRIDLGTLEPAAKLVVRYSTIIRPDSPSTAFNATRAAIFNIDSQNFENTLAQDSRTLFLTDSTEPGVGSFTLINADTNRAIGPVINGGTLRLSQLPANFNIRVDATNTVESVQILSDNILLRTENFVPYSVCGDNNGNYNSCRNTFVLGTYTITAIPFTGDQATGRSGEPLTVQFTLVP